MDDDRDTEMESLVYAGQIHLTSIRIIPLHVSKESISCMSSTHVLPTYWRSARTVIFSPARNYGGSTGIQVVLAWMCLDYCVAAS